MTRAAVFLLLFLAAVCSAQSPPLRVLVITGGHTYHPSFAGLFENQPRLQVMMNGHPGLCAAICRNNTTFSCFTTAWTTSRPKNETTCGRLWKARKGWW